MNPKYIVDPIYFEIFDLWRIALDQPAWSQGCDGLASMKYLPDEGGLNRQCSVLAEALIVVSMTARKIENGVSDANSHSG